MNNMNNLKKIINKKHQNEKLAEVYQILHSDVNINLDTKIRELKHTYKTELKGFKYVIDPDILLNITKKYVRYVGFNNKLYYGGFLVKSEKKNNTTYIYLISTHKQIWSIDFNSYYIFINDIISTKNEKIRKALLGTKLSEERKEKIRQKAIGRKQSKEQIKNRIDKIKQLIWVNNGSINYRILPNLFEEYKNQGFVRGQIIKRKING